MFDKKFIWRIFEIRQRKWQESEENFVTSAPPNNKIKEKKIEGNIAGSGKNKKVNRLSEPENEQSNSYKRRTFS